MILLDAISIRTDFKPGDLGYVIHLHGQLYAREYQYGTSFEMYVARGLAEFYDRYDENLDRIWLCERAGKLVGSLLLMHREGGAAQLRYFLILPEFRGIGLGKKLMTSYMEFFHNRPYTSSYLWTTDELKAAAALYRRFGFKLSEEMPSTSFGKSVVEQRYDLERNE